MIESKAIEKIVIGAEYVNELAKDSGVPGIGLVGHFSQVFYNKYLASRFEKFAHDAEVNEKMLNDILEDENYSNYFYSTLETVRRTHSKLGLIALALLYRDYWNDADVLIPAMRAFAEISDETIKAFIEFYESIPLEGKELDLIIHKGDENFFHPKYNEAVELIHRNFFVQSSAPDFMATNGPIQGMKWDHTDLYYKYCKLAIEKMNEEESIQK